MAHRRRLWSRFRQYVVMLIVMIILLLFWMYLIAIENTRLDEHPSKQMSQFISDVIVIHSPVTTDNPQHIDTDLLIVMVDDRINFNDTSYMTKYKEIEYWFYSTLINLLYAQKWNYSIIFVQTIANKGNWCYARKNKQIPSKLDWCKLEVISYYLNPKEYNDISYNWLLYLDSDAILSQSYIPFNSFLDTLPNMTNKIDMIIGTDIPFWAATQLNLIWQEKLNCSSLLINDTSVIANAGTLLFRRNNNSYTIVEKWADTIFKLFWWKRHWPAEQGAFNCFIGTDPMIQKSILRLKYEYGIKVGMYSTKKESYILHVPGAYSWGRRKYFTKYLSTIIPKLNQTKNMISMLHLMGNLSYHTKKKKLGRYEFVEQAYHFWSE